jgi:hypothetical protein
VVEILNIPALPGGWIAANLLVLALALLTGWALVRLSREFQVVYTGPVLALYAAAPVFVLYGANSMDYMWALAAVAWSVSLSRRHPVWAGLLLGVAVGCRITSAAFGLPLLFIYLPDHRYRDAMRFVFAAVATAAFCWLPVVWTYGLDFFQYAPSQHSIVEIISLLSQNLLGLPGAVLLSGIVGLTLFRSGSLQRVAGSNRDRFLLLATGIGVLPFVMLPEDPAYCLPGLFFGLLWLGRHVTSRRLLWLLTGVCLLSSAVMEVRMKRGFRLELRPGAVVHAMQEQRKQIAQARGLLKVTVVRPACIIAGLDRPVIGVLEPRLLTQKPDDHATLDGITYVYLLGAEEITRMQQDGVHIYATTKSQVSTHLRYGFDLEATGVQILSQSK